MPSPARTGDYSSAGCAGARDCRWRSGAGVERRGQVLAGAVVTEGIRPGVICLHEGAWPDLDPQVGICKNGAVNVLTKDIPTSRLGNGCAGNTALAWLEKYTGPALPLTAFDPPANA